MKIIFIGICNKKGFEPLDSKTPSGQRIDDVVKNFPYHECVRMNLFDSFAVPDRHKVDTYIDDFFDRANIKEKDVCVLLGGTVQKHLGEELSCKRIYAPHPSPLHARFSHSNYVRLVTDMLNSVITPEECDARNDAQSDTADNQIN
jgi:hypothetical protein